MTHRSGNIEPAEIRNGLAMYSVGSGAPIFIMPFPHGFNIMPMVEGPLATVVGRLGRSILTFDPPGAYRSNRSAAVSMPEMLACTEETLDTLGVTGPIDTIGHSMGGLCALALTLERSHLVRRLILVASMAGSPSVRRARGIPWHWHWSTAAFWKFARLGLKVTRGNASMADHKRFLQILYSSSYQNPDLVPDLHIEEEDHRRPAPVRDTWPRMARLLDYRGRLSEVRVPTLVCAGRNDPQAPLACSEELARGIPGAELVRFEHSGHYPFIEEEDRFMDVLRSFLHVS